MSCSVAWGSGTPSSLLFSIKVDTEVDSPNDFGQGHAGYISQTAQISCPRQLSRPLLCLSVATALIDQSDSSEDNLDPSDSSQSNSYPQLEPQTREQTQDASSERLSDPPPQNELSENWLLQLYKELDTQNLTLPERINEDELRRFYAAANGDFSPFFSSIKKTIKWRETYNILTPQELEPWSDLVFWHGRDKKLRPCLFVRLGVASSTLAFNERPLFYSSHCVSN